MEEEDKKLSHRQKQRFVKREQKKVVQKAKLQEKRAKGAKKQPQVRRKTAYNSDSEPEEEVDEVEGQEASSDEEVPQLVPAPTNKKSAASKGFTDENDDWLKPKKGKKQAEPESEEEDDDAEEEDLEEDSEDENGLAADESGEEEEDDDDEEDEDEEASDEDTAQVGKLADLSDDDVNSDDDFDISGAENGADSESDEDDDDEDEDDDDKLPIERANKKLKKREAKEAQEADEEMQMTVDHQDVFQLPNEEEEAEKDLTLQEVQQRIKDVTLVLSDFKKYRQADRSRGEYIELLRRDLCLYYSYNEFLMEKLMDMFPLTELMEYLEASEVGLLLRQLLNLIKTIIFTSIGCPSADHPHQHAEDTSSGLGRSSDQSRR